MGEGRWKMKSGKRRNGGRTLEGRDPLIRIDSLLFYNSQESLKPICIQNDNSNE